MYALGKVARINFAFKCWYKKNQKSPKNKYAHRLHNSHEHTHTHTKRPTDKHTQKSQSQTTIIHNAFEVVSVPAIKNKATSPNKSFRVILMSDSIF